MSEVSAHNGFGPWAEPSNGATGEPSSVFACMGRTIHVCNRCQRAPWAETTNKFFSSSSQLFACLSEMLLTCCMLQYCFRVNCCLLSVVIAKCHTLQSFQCFNEMPCATLLLFSNQYYLFITFPSFNCLHVLAKYCTLQYYYCFRTKCLLRSLFLLNY